MKGLVAEGLSGSHELKGFGVTVERRQFARKTLGGEHALQVSLFLSAQSLVHEGRSEQFELEARAVDISAGGVGLYLDFKADLVLLLPGSDVTIQLLGKRRKITLPARVAHYEQEQGTLGLAFDKPLAEYLV